MKTKKQKIWLVGMLLFLATSMFMSAYSQPQDALQAFPKTYKNMTRYVIELPAKSREANLKIELQVGRMEETDMVNQYFLTGQLEKKVLEGWGLHYYVLQEGVLAQTRMADHSGKTKRRMVFLGKETLLNYNSRTPVVVYLPEGYQLSYRIWKAAKHFSQTNVLKK